MSSPRANIPDAVRATQARASDPASSAFVSANAGSGKTHVLVQRVIRLLRIHERNRVEQVKRQCLVHGEVVLQFQVDAEFPSRDRRRNDHGGRTAQGNRVA